MQWPDNGENTPPHINNYLRRQHQPLPQDTRRMLQNAVDTMSAILHADDLAQAGQNWRGNANRPSQANGPNYRPQGQR